MINDKLFLEEFDEEPIKEAKKAKRRRKKPCSSITYTTGDIGLNIDRFNTAMGTADLGDSGADTGASEGGAMGESLKLKESWEEFDFEDYNSDDTITVVIIDKRFDPLFKKDQKESLKRNNVRVEGQYFNGIIVTGKVGDIIQVCDECRIMHPNKIFMEALSLTEAKRYVRRYYIRPQNIFCSNKAEILKALIELDDANCSVYTLNNLGDDKDVSKLMNSDIIYYYDDGILYDKNHVKVMDYDLSIKKEEDRKKFTKVNDDSSEFKSEYEDRMTSATELEESFMDVFNECDYEVTNADYNETGDKIVVSLNHGVKDVYAAADHLINCLVKADIEILDWNTNGDNVFIFELKPDNAFDLDFDDINVYGESLTEAMHEDCCICGESIDGYGNNPEPYMSADKGRCCDSCNLHFVIPLRIEQSEEA